MWNLLVIYQYQYVIFEELVSMIMVVINDVIFILLFLIYTNYIEKIYEGNYTR